MVFKTDVAARKPNERMRVLLRERATRKLFVNPEEWTTDVLAARDFESTQAVVKYTTAPGLEGCEILLHFPDSNYLMAIPLVAGAVVSTPSQASRSSLRSPAVSSLRLNPAVFQIHTTEQHSPAA